jgi:hypothetical protein
MCYRGLFSHDDAQLTDAPHPHLKFAVGEEKALAAEASHVAFEAMVTVATNRSSGQFKIRVNSLQSKEFTNFPGRRRLSPSFLFVFHQ